MTDLRQAFAPALLLDRLRPAVTPVRSMVIGDSVRGSAGRAGIGLPSGGYGREELAHLGALRVRSAH